MIEISYFRVPKVMRHCVWYLLLCRLTPVALSVAILCSLMNSDILVLSILIFTILTRACSDGRRWRLLNGSIQLPSE